MRPSNNVEPVVSPQTVVRATGAYDFRRRPEPNFAAQLIALTSDINWRE